MGTFILIFLFYTVTHGAQGAQSCALYRARGLLWGVFEWREVGGDCVELCFSCLGDSGVVWVAWG